MMSGVEAPSPEVVAGRQRMHRARQVRARIVWLAQEYREACRAYDALTEHVMHPGVHLVGALWDESLRVRVAIEERRAALFAAVGELEMLEEKDT